jgi:putative addiction module component (TIGR02574 family)
MKRDAADILKDALALPAEARWALVGSLLDSLDQGPDEDAEAAWEAEIARRLEEADAGRLTPVPWAEVRRQLLRR